MVSANQAPQNCMQIPMDKMCKHQQLFDSRDAAVPPRSSVPQRLFQGLC